MYAPYPLPDLDVLRAKLRYEPDTGNLFIRTDGGERLIQPGPVTRYLAVKIDGRKYYAHRVVWKMFYGEDPAGILDHADCNKLNNKISNLRIATLAENTANSVKKKTKPLPKGVSYNAERGMYKATLSISPTTRVSGYFKDMGDARRAYRMAAIARFGSFARFEENAR